MFSFRYCIRIFNRGKLNRFVKIRKIITAQLHCLQLKLQRKIFPFYVNGTLTDNSAARIRWDWLAVNRAKVVCTKRNKSKTSASARIWGSRWKNVIRLYVYSFPIFRCWKILFAQTFDSVHRTLQIFFCYPRVLLDRRRWHMIFILQV